MTLVLLGQGLVLEGPRLKNRGQTGSRYMLPMTDPWDDCIFTYTFSLNGKFRYRYNRPMDLVGYEKWWFVSSQLKQPYCWGQV